VDRETVARNVHRSRNAGSDASPANAPTGSEPEKSCVEAANSVVEPAGSGRERCGVEATETAATGVAGRRNDCQHLHAVIADMLNAGRSAQRIYQDLVAEHGFQGSYYSVGRFVRRLSAGSPPLPFRGIEKEPSEETQVDFGAGAPIVRGGQRRRPHVFRLVLSCSRKAYSEAVYRQTTTDAFLQVIEDAFRHRGVKLRLPSFS
jgi:transposase